MRFVHTPEERPYAVPFTRRIASSASRKRITGDTGPKVSSRTSSISGVTPSSTVGE
jgi:hypothetical protein